MQVGGSVGDGVARVGFQQTGGRAAAHVEVHQQHPGVRLTRQFDAEMCSQRGRTHAAFHGQEADHAGLDVFPLHGVRRAAVAGHRMLQHARQRLAAGAALDEVVLRAALDCGDILRFVGCGGVDDDRQAVGVALDGLEGGQALGIYQRQFH